VKNLKNKGAAMISVLVATVFIAIIATTLLYMAYLNYLTKAVRNASNDNFYTCEYALDDLATSLQQIAAETNSPADAISQLRLNCVGTAGNTSGKYDNAKVTSLIKLASQVANISVSTNVPTTADNFIVSGNSITLKGLVITADSINDADPYHATISTDLTLSFNTSSEGGMDVNDFSIIGDDHITWSDGGRCVMTGNIFIRSQGWMDAHVTYDALGKGTLDNYKVSSTDYTNVNRNAITCGSIVAGATTNSDVLSLTGDRGIIIGNIVVGKGGVLTITGEVNVIGNIYLLDGGVLLCTKQLQCLGDVYISGGTLGGVSGESQIKSASMNTSFLIDKDKAGTGITANLMDTFYLVYPTQANSNYAYAEFSARMEEKYDALHHGGHCNIPYATPSSIGYLMHTLNQEQGPVNCRWSATNSTGTVQIAFSTSNPTNGFDKPTLLFNIWPAGFGGYSGLVLEKDLSATTMLSIGEVTNKNSFQNGFSVSHMSDEDYEAARMMLFQQVKGGGDDFKKLIDATYVGSATTGDAYGKKAEGFSGFQSGSMSDMMAIVDGWNAVPSAYNHDGSNGVYVKSYTAGTLKTETRYAVWSGGKIYLPVDYLIRPDAGEFITQIFNSLSSAGSPTNTNISYDNWKKNDF